MGVGVLHCFQQIGVLGGRFHGSSISKTSNKSSSSSTSYGIRQGVEQLV
jgi:hypothetical protein